MQLFFMCNIVALSPVVSLTTEVAPVQRVLHMMTDMLVNSKKAKSEEQVNFFEYKQYCQSTSAEKSRAIMDGQFQIAQLNAVISKAAADASTLASEIEFLANDIDELSSQKAMNQEDRTQGHNDYMSSIDAVDRALVMLSSHDSSAPGQNFTQVKNSLVVLKSLNLPSTAKRAVMDFINSNLDRTEVAIEELRQKFKDEEHELEKQEAQEKRASNRLSQDLQSNIDRSRKEQAHKMASMAQWEMAMAEAQRRLLNATTSLAADTQYHVDFTNGCGAKALQYEENQSVREAEIKTLTQVIESMSGRAVAGGSKHLLALAQKRTSFAQFRPAGQRPTQKKVAAFLSDSARKMKSQVLSSVAVKVAKDPFQEVKKEIQDVVLKLMDEAFEETEEKAFCDPEVIQIGTNKNTHDTEEVQKTPALVEELTASIAKLGLEAADLSDEIADLDNAMAQATNFRSEEKMHNAAIVADAKVGFMATAQALQDLNDFYGQSGGSVAQSSSNTDVTGILELIESDFLRLETETQVAEERAEKDYTTFIRNSSRDKAAKSTEVKHKINEKMSKQSDLEIAKKGFNGTQEDLASAVLSAKKQQDPYIHVEAGESHEERVMRRNEEIKLLRDALKML